MRFSAFALTLAAVGVFSACQLANAQTKKMESVSVSVAVGGRNAVTYLPLTLADRLGYFKDEGLSVTLNDFSGGSKSIEALVGNSADVAVGAFEQTLLIQRRHMELKAVALFNRTYGAVIALKPELAKKYKSPADLKGGKFGVTAPGTSGALALTLLLAKANLPATDISVIGIGVGPGALAAAKSGELDGVAQFDPIVSQLLLDGDMVPIVDTRTAEGMKYLYGGFIAASSVITTPKMIKERPEALQHFVNAIVRALRWLHKSTPEQVADTVPKGYYGDRKDLYMTSVEKVKDTFTTDGRYTKEDTGTIFKVVSTYGPLKGVQGIVPENAYDNTFVDHVPKP
jgi:NitT/TauT family transport system substrate-binding protein